MKLSSLLLLCFYLSLWVSGKKEQGAVLEYNCSGEFQEDNLFEVGNEMTICMHFLPHMMKLMYKVTVDQPYFIVSKSAFSKFTTGDTDYLIQMQNSDIFTYPIAFIRGSQHPKKFYPFLSLIIHIENGIFMDFVYENMEGYCDLYNSAPFIQNSEVFYKDIKTKDQMLKLCEYDEDHPEVTKKLIVFITWSGTDKYGRQLSSSLLTFQAMKNYDQEFRLHKLLAQQIHWEEKEVAKVIAN